EQWQDVPEEFRPPRSGRWLALDPPRTLPLADTVAGQQLLQRIFDVFTEEGDDDETVGAWTWLDMRADDAGRGRMALMAGSHLLGLVAEDGGKDVKKQVRRRARKGEVVWVTTWVERHQDGRYIVDVRSF